MPVDRVQQAAHDPLLDGHGERVEGEGGGTSQLHLYSFSRFTALPQMPDQIVQTGRAYKKNIPKIYIFIGIPEELNEKNP